MVLYIIYTGLYGYSITDAGLRSEELFDKRGWSTIVSDKLVPNVLLLITIAITDLTYHCICALIKTI